MSKTLINKDFVKVQDGLKMYQRKECYFLLYPIKSHSNKDFIWNKSETLFFNALHSKLTTDENKHIILHRLSSGAIEPYFKSYPLGKVKLQGKKYYVQVFKSLYKVDVYEGTVEQLIEKVDMTVEYLRKYCKK